MDSKKKKKSSPAATILLVLLFLAAIGMISAGIYFIFFKNRDAFERQDLERDLADEYIDDMILKLTDPEAYEKRIEERRLERLQQQEDSKKRDFGDYVSDFFLKLTDPEEYARRKAEEESAAIDVLDTGDNFNYEDENYYTRDGITYTPDYAVGVVDSVLEVPTAGIRRPVYTGTWDEINFDLDIWMVTVARPDYTLGETHYCIYGHNHTVQDLSFNKLQTVQVGEYFYLTAESGRYTYEITNVFAVSRSSATTDYVDNFGFGADKCFLITCGRDDGVRNFRYLDLMVEGTLVEHLTLEEYAASRKTEQK